MKKTTFVIFLVFLLIALPLAGCLKAAGSKKAMPVKIDGEDLDEGGGANSYDNSGDHEESPYWKSPDFYRMKSNEHLTIIPEFATFQQTTEWSCGPSSILMVLNYYGIEGYTEWDIAVGSRTSVDEDTPGAEPGSANNYYEYGASVRKLHQFLETVPQVEIVDTSYVADYSGEDLITDADGFTENDMGNLFPGFSANALYASENADDTELFVEDAADSYFVRWLRGHLEAGRPVLVEWGDWDGHWMVIIGYDTMGTPGIGDDVIIFADPYDTSDHWQDGYYFYPAERWFTLWRDRNVAEKPYQLQPYIVFGLR